MLFLAPSALTVAIPYAIERLFFSRKFGFFAALFWLFVVQSCALLGGEFIFESHIAQSMPGWVKSVGVAIGAIAYLTIGMTPLVAVVAAVGFGAVIATMRYLRKIEEN
ncbi:hypothetical protein [Mesorhizobium sp.]|uniref:hypothetical protein n=1 Tax=Mesorhizobium sp. TaxID=1871066 RepID=UPI0025F747ED|nr:hypothetical protein [Mesorhizobium sp.]